MVTSDEETLVPVAKTFAPALFEYNICCLTDGCTWVPGAGIYSVIGASTTFVEFDIRESKMDLPDSLCLFKWMLKVLAFFELFPQTGQVNLPLLPLTTASSGGCLLARSVRN